MEAFETEVNRRQNLHLPFSRTITVPISKSICLSQPEVTGFLNLTNFTKNCLKQAIFLTNCHQNF